MPILVEYRGVADVFTMRASDFAAAGFGAQPTTSWSKANGYEVSVPDDVALWLLSRPDFDTPYSEGFSDALEGVMSGAISSSRGFHVPLKGMNRLRQSGNAHRNVVLLGDSNFQGNVGGPPAPYFSKKVRDGFWGMLYSTVVVHGFQPVWRLDAGVPDMGRWVLAGNMGTANPDAASYNLAPFSGAALGGKNMLAAVGANNGAASTATWTKASEMGYDAGYIYYVDGPGTGSNFSYQVQGGAWTNVPMTRPATPELKRVAIVLNVPATAASPVVIRAADAAGVACDINGLLGISVAPGAFTPGVVVHNFGRGGAGFGTGFANINTSGTREWWRVFDLIAPELTLVCFSNDDYVVGTPQSDRVMAVMDEIVTRLRPHGDILFISQPVQNKPSADQQAFIRAKNDHMRSLYNTYRNTSGNAVAFMEMQGRWGWDYAAAVTAGFMGDDLHFSDAGAADISAAVHRMLRLS